ncbi:MAG: LCP family protein [Anaerolineales bacterium]|nr:LCP family protein [Anaerolineales bacterium]
MKLDRKRRIKRPSNLPDWVVWALAAVFGALAIASAVLIFSSVRNLVGSWTGVGLNPFNINAGNSEEAAADPETTPTVMRLESTPEPWNGTDRVTMLLMGLDYRDWLSGDGPPRTDSMMLVTVDPITKEAAMLSIPRDLWVEIPGYSEHSRINGAYFLGERDNLPGGGPGLAMATVENLLGVPVDYYAVIDFLAFEEAIDEIGGIDVLVRERIKISPIGELSYWLEPKGHHLNGAEALAYARARHTEGGDFDRAERQQQVALAVIDRVLGFDMVPVLLTRAPALYEEISSGIITNLGMDQMISLGLLVLEIDKKTIKRGVIAPPEMVLLETLPDGAEVLKPVPEKIRALRDELFTTTGAIRPSNVAADTAEAARLEAAALEVLNGSGQPGVAGTAADYLQELGLTVTSVGNAERMDYVKTVVIDYTGNPYTRRYLMEAMSLTEGQILSQPIEDSQFDMSIILGSDFYIAP